MHTRYQGKSEPLPKEYFTESGDSHYENVNEVDSDPDFYLNYSESEESGWSTSSKEEEESESSDSESSEEEEESKRDEIIPCPCPGKCKIPWCKLTER